MTQNTSVDLVLQIIHLHDKVQKKLARSLSAHGIGVSEFLVLKQLYAAANQRLSRGELAEQVGLSPSGVTRLLNPMEKIGLVDKEANPRDARVSWVTLSSAGAQIYEDAQTSFTQAAVAMLEPLTSTRLNALVEGLKDATRVVVS